MWRFTGFLLFFGLLPLAGCFLPPKATVPMDVIWFDQDPVVEAKTLF